MKDVIFTYKFIKAGSSIVNGSGREGIAGLKQDRIYLDVGNRFETGAIDCQQFKSLMITDNKVCRSVASLLAAFPQLVLDNISENAARIEFVLHHIPDMDCFVAVFMAQKLIREGKFALTSHIEQIIQYVNEINLGRLRINSNFIKMPNILVYAIEEIESAKLKKEFASKGEEITARIEDEQYLQILSENIMQKGLKLIEYIYHKLSGFAAGERILYLSLLLAGYNGLAEEYEFIKHDYQKYCDEVYGKNSTCEQIKIKLPLKDSKTGSGDQLLEVDGLKWHDTPASILAKYWAWQDRNAPGKDGYVFTFIPVVKNKLTDPVIINGKKIKKEVNKVLISVDPAKNVTLKRLGQLLEIREQEKKRTVLDGRQNDLRYEENDPWNDGREFAYSLVETPQKGSILSIEEIYDIVLAFEKPFFNKLVVRIVIPFKYSARLFSKIKTDDIVQEDRKNEVGNYFLPYINEYFFNSKHSKKICKFIRFKTGNGNLPESDAEIIYSNNESFRKRDQIDLIVFSHGTGIIYTDYDCANLAFDQVLEMNSKLFNSSRNAVDKYTELLEDVLNLKINIESEYIKLYNYADIDEKTYYPSELKGTLYRIVNAIGNKQDYRTLVFNEEMDKDLIQINRSAFFYVNRLGSVLFTVNTGTDKEKGRKRIEGLAYDFLEKHFLIFILVLDLQMNLIAYSIEMAAYGKYKREALIKNIKSLREKVINFTAVAVFSQITNDDIGMLLYRKWNEIFENKIIHDEVFTQLSALDEFNKASITRTLEKLSWIFLPIMTMSAFFSIGWVKIVPIVGGSVGLDRVWWSIVIVLCAGWIIFLFLKWTIFAKRK